MTTSNSAQPAVPPIEGRLEEMVIIRSETGTIIAIVPFHRRDVAAAIMSHTRTEGTRHLDTGLVAVPLWKGTLNFQGASVEDGKTGDEK